VNILGIESSCDETSAAVVCDGTLLSVVISSQEVHAEFGGIVPELASRAHLQSIVPIINKTLDQAGIALSDIDVCAATQGPGLIGSLLVGLHTAKGIAIARDIPFYPIHHIEAHLFSTFLEEDHPAFPFLGLVVSGGHTQIMRIDGIGDYCILGTTIDDAAGEAYDKVAKMMGLGFPGGPVVDELAKKGNPATIKFPRPAMDKNDYSFSFSGLKTSVLYFLRKHTDVQQDSGSISIPDALLNDICAGFQAAVVDVLVHKTLKAAKELDINDIAVVGGVSANSELARRMIEGASSLAKSVFIPEAIYSTDNAAMVAMLAWLKAAEKHPSELHSPAFARMTGARGKK
jgi:tRNA N6-adenosine threonylcarbamoyltransferase